MLRNQTLLPTNYEVKGKPLALITSPLMGVDEQEDGEIRERIGA
jgi:hypothetical protein